MVPISLELVTDDLTASPPIITIKAMIIKSLVVQLYLQMPIWVTFGILYASLIKGVNFQYLVGSIRWRSVFWQFLPQRLVDPITEGILPLDEFLDLIRSLIDPCTS